MEHVINNYNGYYALLEGILDYARTTTKKAIEEYCILSILFAQHRFGIPGESNALWDALCVHEKKMYQELAWFDEQTNKYNCLKCKRIIFARLLYRYAYKIKRGYTYFVVPGYLSRYITINKIEQKKIIVRYEDMQQLVKELAFDIIHEHMNIDIDKVIEQYNEEKKKNKICLTKVRKKVLTKRSKSSKMKKNKKGCPKNIKDKKVKQNGIRTLSSIKHYQGAIRTSG